MENIELRDYFAAKALQAMLTCLDQHQMNPYGGLKNITENAYKIADEMIKTKGK